MSWLSGSQLTPTSFVEASTPEGPANPAMFSDRFACVTATPLGDDVDPDVNCTNAMSSSDGRVSESSGGASSSSAHRTTASSGHSPRTPSKAGASARVVTTARAPEVRRIAEVSSRYRGRSALVAGGYNDAGMTPAIDAPNSTVRNTSASGRINPTRSPGRSPASRSAPAACRDAPYMSAYDRHVSVSAATKQ